MGIAGLVVVGTVAASQHPERTFSPASVAPGGEVEVTLTRTGLGAGVGQVRETLPAGFTYVAGSVAVADAAPAPRAGVSVDARTTQGQVVSFNVAVADSIKYKVMVADSVADGPHEFTGQVLGLAGQQDIAANSVTVATGATPDPSPSPSPSPSPTTPAAGLNRSFSAASVRPGARVEVTISGIGAANGVAQVVETLPGGFSYVHGSAAVADASPASRSGVTGTVDSQNSQIVRFDLVAADSIKYRVDVDSGAAEQSYTFSGGIVKSLTGSDESIPDSSITVSATAGLQPTGAVRSFNPATIPVAAAPGANVTVTITGLGIPSGVGQVLETLPDGFSFVDESEMIADANPSDRSAILATVDGQVVTFDIIAANSVSYQVEIGADIQPGTHTFRGVLKELTSEGAIEATSVRVDAPPPPPTRVRRSGGGGGFRYIPPPETPTPAPTATPRPTATMAPPTPVPTLSAMEMEAVKGDKGDQGDPGDQGDKGAKGDRGDTGAKGPTGDAGAAGADGAPGAAGAKGDAGDAGRAGGAGPDGGGSPLGLIAFILAVVAVLGAGGVFLARRGG